MRLCRMYKEWMTQVDCPRCSSGSHLVHSIGCVFQHLSQLHKGQPRFPSRCKQTSHLQMRAASNACRRVPFHNIGKQKEHQQCTPLGMHIESPFEVGIDRLIWWKACVNMPTCISRVVRM